MTSTERDILHLKLREVLGVAEAATLMSLVLPDPSQLATKADIKELSLHADGFQGRMDRLEERMDRLEERMDRLEERMDRLEERMDRLEERMDRLEELMVKFDQRLWDFHEALRAQTRVYITAMVSTMIGVGALAFGAAALV